jgi:hypothetical protein
MAVIAWELQQAARDLEPSAIEDAILRDEAARRSMS